MRSSRTTTQTAAIPNPTPIPVREQLALAQSALNDLSSKRTKIKNADLEIQIRVLENKIHELEAKLKQSDAATGNEDQRDPQRKAATGGNSPTEKLIIAKKGDSIVGILRDLGASGTDLNAITRVLGPRSFEGGIKEGQKLRILMAQALDGQRLQPIRVIIAGDSGIDAVIALADTGKYVAVDVKNVDTDIAATSRMAAKLSQSEIDALRARLMALWSPPVGVQDPNELIVNVTVRLRPDGRLAAPPFARVNGRSVAAMASRDSALRAILTSQPFDMLKPENYERWKEIELTFDPTSK